MEEPTKVLEEKETTMKKENSYTYWVKPANPDVKIDTAPVKLDKPLVETTKTQNKGLGPSSWNSSGTWEERKVSIKELEERIKTAFQNYVTTDGKARIDQVTVTGDISIYFSRGKKGVTYQLKIVLSYKGTEGQTDASGDFTFEELTDHGDCETTVSSKGDANKQAVKKSVVADRQKYIKLIEAELNRYKE